MYGVKRYPMNYLDYSLVVNKFKMKNCTLDYEETMVYIDNKYAMISRKTD